MPSQAQVPDKIQSSSLQRNLEEIPKNNLEENFNYTICVFASEQRQKERLLHRGLTKDESNDRIRSQLPTKEKSRLADIVLLGEGSFSFLKRQICHLHANIYKPVC